MGAKKLKIEHPPEHLMLSLANFCRCLFSYSYCRARLGLLTVCLLCPLQAQSEPFDWKSWDHILKHYIHSGTADRIQAELIDYRALKRDPDFYRLADALKSYDPASLNDKEKMAFYINSYNYFAVKLVVENWPVNSIQDIGIFFWPVWRHTAGYINGHKVTLNQIEHEILRPMGDPRIHFAINCASLSCPDLRNEAYNGRQLDSQLDEQCKRFMDNPSKGVQINGSTIRISSIFDWYEEDFATTGGAASFIRQYRKLPSPITNMEYMPYNWRLNATVTSIKR